MSSIGTLYGTAKQAKTKRIKAVAAIAGVSLEDPANYVHFETNKTPEFLKKFASGKIPAFEDAEGFTLFEASAIARYIASFGPNTNLLGSNVKEAALVDQWVSFIDNEIVDLFTNLDAMYGHRLPYHKPYETLLRERLTRAYGTVEKHLANRTFFVGERLSLADITAASSYVSGFQLILDSAWRSANPHTTRWFNTIVNQPALKPVFGEVAFVETAVAYVAPVKEKKPVVEQPKQEKKPKAKKEAEADDEEEEPLVPEEPKKKNPLDDLPKSTFNLEEWKRVYSNNDTRGAGGSLEWLYKNFDHEGFSAWRVDYKYNDELTLLFMSNNLIGGFFNRLEASRKYLFGSMGVLGESHKSIVAGAFILRGQDYLPVVDVAPDWESYTFKKVDFENADDKAFFEAALAWDLEIDGKKWADGTGKNFK